MAAIDQSRIWEEAASPHNNALVQRFSADWRRVEAGPADVASYLPDDPARRPAALLALLRADLALRRSAGELIRVEWYLRGFPELPADVLLALVYEEYCVREEAGESPDPREYDARFPAIATEVRELIDLHEFVDSGCDENSSDDSSHTVSFPSVGETIGGFRLVEELGRGGMARVFLALERHLADRPVALKVSRVGSREPQTLALLQHTHIVPVFSYHVDVITGLHLLCMPYFGRVTLADILAAPAIKSAKTGTDLLSILDALGTSARSRPRAEGRQALGVRSYARAIAWWGARLAEALQYAHDRGVWHHDIKPSNVLVTADATPMLLDFNLARPAAPDGHADAEPGGTLAYMAPEHLAAVGKLHDRVDQTEARVDGRADIYALGLVLREALGWHPVGPLEVDGPALESLRALFAARSAPMPRRNWRDSDRSIPSALGAVIARCLEPDPADRYSLAAQLAADLQAVADDRSLCFAREPEPGKSLKRAWRNRRWLAAGAGVVVLFTSIFVVQTAALRRESLARLDLAGGNRLASAGEFTAAAAQFAMALDRAGTGTSPALRSIAAEALRRKTEVLAAGRMRDRADAFFVGVEAIRFRLITGHGLEAASEELLTMFAEFKVFGSTPWTHDPELDLLDPARRARLVDEVNEVLYLWVIASDEPGDVEQGRRAAAVCARALSFAQPAAPWHALSARYAARQSKPDRIRPVAAEEPSARACFQWGLLDVLEGRPETALSWFERAVSLSPGRFWYQFALAYHHALYGDAAQAMAHYDAAVALRPASAWARFNRAQLAWSRQGAWERALVDLEYAKARPDDLDAELLALEMGRVSQRLGDYPAAIQSNDAVIASGGARDLARQARRNRARAMVELGPAGRAQAWDEFNRLVGEVPSDTDARHDRAWLALRTGRAAVAAADLTHLLAQAGNSTTPVSERAGWLAARALANLALERTADAVCDSDRAFALAPAPGRLRIRLRVAIAAGRVTELAGLGPDDMDRLPAGGRRLMADLGAIAEKVRGSLVPNALAKGGASELSSTLTLAAIDSARGSHTRALAEADRAVALSPLAADVWLGRAGVRRRAGDPIGATADVDSGLALAPGDSRLQCLRARLLIEFGQPLEGLAELDRALAAGAGGHVHRARAQAFWQLAQWQESIAAWTLALRDDPEDADAYIGRARCFVRLGRWDAALADLESAVDCSYDRPVILAQVAVSYASCLAQRPNRLSRALGLAARALVAQLID